ncbi:MAG TPA: hypothetical protein VNN10_06495 [Dehalococcoidia bacterium]|nr:hypothetical protein [Dehalococcoidia bacterium]
MAEENVGALFAWGRALVQTAASAGFPMAALPESGQLSDFIAWARSVNSGIGAMASLPSLPDDAGYEQVLAWARALDGTARGMGAALPPLP